MTSVVVCLLFILTDWWRQWQYACYLFQRTWFLAYTEYEQQFKYEQFQQIRMFNLSAKFKVNAIYVKTWGSQKLGYIIANEFAVLLNLCIIAHCYFEITFIQATPRYTSKYENRGRSSAFEIIGGFSMTQTMCAVEQEEQYKHVQLLSCFLMIAASYFFKWAYGVLFATGYRFYCWGGILKWKEMS